MRFVLHCCCTPPDGRGSWTPGWANSCADISFVLDLFTASVRTSSCGRRYGGSQGLRATGMVQQRVLRPHSSSAHTFAQDILTTSTIYGKGSQDRASTRPSGFEVSPKREANHLCLSQAFAAEAEDDEPGSVATSIANVTTLQSCIAAIVFKLRLVRYFVHTLRFLVSFQSHEPLRTKIAEEIEKASAWNEFARTAAKAIRG